MVVLPIVDSNRPSCLEHCAVLRHTIGNTCEEFRQVECRISVMTNPEEEHLPIKVVHATDGAFRDVGW
jgi:hypothetical protein